MIYGQKGMWAVNSGGAVAYYYFSNMELEKYDQMLKLNINVRPKTIYQFEVRQWCISKFP